MDNKDKVSQTNHILTSLNYYCSQIGYSKFQYSWGQAHQLRQANQQVVKAVEEGHYSVLLPILQYLFLEYSSELASHFQKHFPGVNVRQINDYNFVKTLLDYQSTFLADQHQRGLASADQFFQ